MVTDLVQSYNAMWCNMSVKVLFLDSYLDLFQENPGAVSNIHGERFHREICTMEKPYQDEWSASVVTDYCLDTQNRRSSGKI
jgi:hypothetical protein